jgi:hypothetical protein
MAVLNVQGFFNTMAVQAASVLDVASLNACVRDSREDDLRQQEEDSSTPMPYFVTPVEQHHLRC